METNGGIPSPQHPPISVDQLPLATEAPKEHNIVTESAAEKVKQEAFAVEGKTNHEDQTKPAPEAQKEVDPVAMDVKETNDVQNEVNPTDVKEPAIVDPHPRPAAPTAPVAPPSVENQEAQPKPAPEETNPDTNGQQQQQDQAPEEEEEKPAPLMPSDDALKTRINEILSTSDLNTITAKKLRGQLEEEFKVGLKEKKNFVKEVIDAYLSASQKVEEGEEEEEEGVPSQKSGRKRSRGGGGGGFGDVLSPAMQAFLNMERCPRTQVVKKLWEYIREHDLQDPKNRRRIVLDDKMKTIFPGASVTMFSMQKHLSKHVKFERKEDVEEEESDDGDEEEGDEDSDDDDGEEQEKKPKKKATARSPAKRSKRSSSGDSGGTKLNGFTKPVAMTPDLAAFMGTETASRPQITKKFWAYVKENGLQDPENKQFIIADEALLALTGEKRFQGFSFSKLIKDKILGYA